MSGAKSSFEQIKKKLLERKHELEQEMANMGQGTLSADQVQDLGDQVVTSTMETLRSSLQNSKIGEYKRLKQALAMIEQGTYGVCIDCDKQISPKRLQSFPNAARCLACQETFEVSGG